MSQPPAGARSPFVQMARTMADQRQARLLAEPPTPERFHFTADRCQTCGAAHTQVQAVILNLAIIREGQ